MPATATDRLYGLTTSVAVKAPCRTVAAAPVTLAGLQTVGGVTLVDGDRVLVTGQVDSTQNGIYNASSGSWPRAKDFDGNRDVVNGTLISVLRNSGSQDLYEVVATNPVVIGSTSMTFALRYAANSRYVVSSAETAAGMTISDDSFAYGDPRRSSTYRSGAWLNFGDVPTRVDGDTFTVPGDRTSRYSRGRRVQLIGTGGINESRILNATFAAGITTVDLINDISGNGGLTGGVPTGLQIVSLSVAADTNTKNAFIQDFNGVTGQDFINKNLGTSAASRLVVGNYDSDSAGAATSNTSALAVVVTGGTYNSSYLPGMAAGRNVVLHTGLDVPITIGTWDSRRIFIPSEFATNLLPITFFNPLKLVGNQQSVRLCASADPGNTWMAFFRVDETTRKGTVGYSGADNTFRIINEESASGMVVQSTGTVSLISGTNKYTVTSLPNFANDAAASAGGVDVGQLYRNGSVVMIRVT